MYYKDNQNFRNYAYRLVFNDIYAFAEYIVNRVMQNNNTPVVGKVSA